MAGDPKDIQADLAPGDAPIEAAYARDFYSWLMEQARHLRDGRFAALDRDSLAEEIESSGREQFNKLVSALRVLMLHMLKWDHQPSLRSRSWVLSIEEQRLEIADVLADNPGLKPRIGEAIARAYRRARIEAAKETGLEETAFAVNCPIPSMTPRRAFSRGKTAQFLSFRIAARLWVRRNELLSLSIIPPYFIHHSARYPVHALDLNQRLAKDF